MNHDTKKAAFSLSFALAVIDDLQKGEKPKSARWNRLQGAVDSINRALDLYPGELSPEDFEKAAGLFDEHVEKIGKMYR